MALPASYTEQTLAEYMHATLSDVATALGFSVQAGSYAEAVNEAIAAYGVDDVTTVTGRDNIRKLRALARREAWKAALAALASRFDFETDGQRFDRSQMHKQVLAQLALVESELTELGIGSVATVSIGSVDYVHDPYRVIPDELRTLG